VYDDGGGYGGILLDSATIAGAQDYVITFQAETGEEPFISTGNINGHGIEIVNTFKQLNFDNIDISTTHGHGYFFNNAFLLSGATIQHCNIENFDSADIAGNMGAVYISNTPGNSVDNVFVSSNTITMDDWYGIFTSYADGVRIENNFLQTGDDGGYYGIFLNQCGDSGAFKPLIYGNTVNDPSSVSAADFAVYMSGANTKGLQVSNNMCIGAAYGMQINCDGGASNSDHNVVFNNLIVNAEVFGLDVLGASHTDIFSLLLSLPY
ncbi:hypothetical protein ACFLR5_02055, partial [Elusimicrobiota bacterium]